MRLPDVDEDRSWSKERNAPAEREERGERTSGDVLRAMTRRRMQRRPNTQARVHMHTPASANVEKTRGQASLEQRTHKENTTNVEARAGQRSRSSVRVCRSKSSVRKGEKRKKRRGIEPRLLESLRAELLDGGLQSPDLVLARGVSRHNVDRSLSIMDRSPLESSRSGIRKE